MGLEFRTTARVAKSGSSNELLKKSINITPVLFLKSFFSCVSLRFAGLLIDIKNVKS